MLKNKLIISIILILFIVSVCIFAICFYNAKTKSSDNISTEIVDKTEDDKLNNVEKNVIEEQLEEENKVVDEKQEVIEDKDTVIDNTVPKKETNKNVVPEVDSSKESNKETSTSKGESNETISSGPTNNNSHEKIEEPKTEVNIESEENNIWDDLGITENEYYNSPMLKWQYVTHATFDECQLEGENTINNSDSGYTQYWCYEVNSYSGRFLGFMLRLIS